VSFCWLCREQDFFDKTIRKIVFYSSNYFLVYSSYINSRIRAQAQRDMYNDDRVMVRDSVWIRSYNKKLVVASIAINLIKMWVAHSESKKLTR